MKMIIIIMFLARYDIYIYIYIVYCMCTVDRLRTSRSVASTSLSRILRSRSVLHY